MTYIMITPVKNEMQFIVHVAESVIAQHEQPALWVIIDGGSNDGTIEAIERLSSTHSWITVIRQVKVQQNANTTHQNVALAVSEAYTFAKHYCAVNNIVYDYVWTIDGDQILPPSICSGIINKMNTDSTVGAASGAVNNGRGGVDSYPKGEISNKRVYRVKALEDIGGFPVSKYSYDTVILAKLRIKGWQIKEYSDCKILNLRDDYGVERDAWKSHVQFGKARYYLGYSILLLTLGCGYLVLHGKITKAIGVFVGFMESWYNHDEIIDDESVWSHFHYDRIGEILPIFKRRSVIQ